MYRETIVNRHEVLADGHRVWVNGPDGASVARFAVLHGLSQAAIDVHHPFCEQAKKGQCLDCFNGPISMETWNRFVSSVETHCGVRVPTDFMPKAIHEAR